MARKKSKKSKPYVRLIIVLSLLFLGLGVWFQFFWDDTPAPDALPFIRGCPKPWRTRVPQQATQPQAHVYNDLNCLRSRRSKPESLLPVEKPLSSPKRAISSPQPPSLPPQKRTSAPRSIDDLLD